jgi:hypothetical protein
MIEELTPQILAIGLLAVLLVAPGLTLLLSALILWLYRRAVLRAMAATAGGVDVARSAGPQPPMVVRRTEAAIDVDRRLMRAPWRAAARYALAGAAFAVVMALAVGMAFPALRSASGFAVPLWITSWPVVMALALTACRACCCCCS